MLLSKILMGIENEGAIGFSERDVSSVTDYSGDCSEGSAFVCVNGARYDGKAFIGEARTRGARTFVSSEKLALNQDETLILSKNPRKTLAEMAKLIYFDSFRNLKIIGVTGTKGKTTVAKLIFECLRSVERAALLIGTLGVESFGFETERQSLDNTTPSAPIIYKLLAEASERGAGAAVIEVSSQALSEYRVFGIPFSTCIFTNFSPDHIGVSEHKSIEEYYNAKRRLFLENAGCLAVVNGDDPLSERISAGVLRTVAAARYGNADYRVRVIESDEGSLSFLLNGERFSLSFGGDYNAINAALAIATVSEMYSREPSFFSNIISRAYVRGRYELYHLDGRRIIIDFAHNKESFRSVCKSAREVCRGRLIAVFGSVGERSFLRRRELAVMAETYADISIITSDNPGYESPKDICGGIYAEFSDPAKAKVIEDREEAIRYAVSISRPSDFILLLGKGHEEYQLVEGRKIPFSERDIILSLGAKKIEYGI